MKEIFTGNNGLLSSKRIIGTFLLAYAVFVNSWFIFVPEDIPDNVFELTKSLAWAGAVMITGGVAEDLLKKK